MNVSVADIALAVAVMYFYVTACITDANLKTECSYSGSQAGYVRERQIIAG